MPVNNGLVGLWEGGMWRKVAVLVGSATAAVALLVLVERYLRRRRGGWADVPDEGIEMDMVEEEDLEHNSLRPTDDVHRRVSPAFSSTETHYCIPEQLHVLTGSKAEEKRIVVLGLDGVGKSSFLACIANQDCRQAMKPTEGFNVMCIQTRQTSLNMWEIGGTENVRSYWANFLPNTEVLVFVVDSTDKARLPLAKEELHKVLAHPALKAVPLLVLANKQDVAGAMSVEQVSSALNLDSFRANRVVQILPTEVPPGLPTKTDSTKKAEDMLTTLSRS
ncbi:ARL10 [Branchiostoma lanceolatum]|uniref:ARL10 protein n=1 Tax=Branchiostoma lanceolatum TaxID=7740 RepID=A0A8J9ZLP5_BRALA|nr:ARL10 [Branchiostoma lanceolatum]